MTEIVNVRLASSTNASGQSFPHQELLLDQAPAVAHQDQQHREGFRRQRNEQPVSLQAVLFRLEPEVPEQVAMLSLRSHLPARTDAILERILSPSKDALPMGRASSIAERVKTFAANDQQRSGKDCSNDYKQADISLPHDWGDAGSHHGNGTVDRFRPDARRGLERHARVRSARAPPMRSGGRRVHGGSPRDRDGNRGVLLRIGRRRVRPMGPHGKQSICSNIHREFLGPDGTVAATYKVRGWLSLGPTGDTFAGPFTTEFFDLAGNLLGTVTGTVSAARIIVQP